jgi:hypothetical protein
VHTNDNTACCSNGMACRNGACSTTIICQ